MKQAGLATSAPRPTDRAEQKSPQIAFWATVGAISCIVILTGWTRWLLSSDFTRTPNGPDPISGPRLVMLHTIEIVALVVGLSFAWHFLLRPLIFERRLTLDGKIMIAAFLMWFYDPLVNLLNFTASYNTHLLNRGSWANFIPGLQYPNQNLLAEPLLFTGGSYFWWVMIGGLIGCSGMRKLQARFPHRSTLANFGILFIVFAFVDLCLEILFTRTQIYVYVGVPRLGTLFPDHRYQYPIFAAFAAAALWVGVTMLRYYRDDQGLTFVERGIERLRLPKRARTLISLLAVTGFLHVLILGVYYLPWQVFAMKARTAPAFPSYLRAGICGDNTNYACPSEFVPVPRRGSVEIGPDDSRLPETVRARQGVR